MIQRVSLITLGVNDKEKARRFYEALGWRGVGGTYPGWRITPDGAIFLTES